MKRMLICSSAWLLMLSSVAHAQDNPFKSLWPFGSKKQAATPTFDNIDPFSAPQRTEEDDSLFRFPSPTKFVDKAGATTGAMFSKTKESWRGMQNFGKNLNPFAGKTKAKKPKKKAASFLSRLWPKKEPDPPATVGEFLSMKRPTL